MQAFVTQLLFKLGFKQVYETALNVEEFHKRQHIFCYLNGTKTLTNCCVPFRLKSSNISSKGTRKEISQDTEPHFPKNIN